MADGDATPAVWLGNRRVDCRRHPRPQDVRPIRVCADAFAIGQPFRDLWLSPDHAVFINGVLIPIRYLLNGKTIVQERAESVVYWHVELRKHGVLLADGLPCESYLNTGNRGSFANGGGTVQMHPDFALRVWEAQACADLVRDGAQLAAVRRALLRRAESLGHVLTDEHGLRVVVNDRELAGTVVGRLWCVRLAEATSSVRLVSRRWTPAHVRPDEDDARALGIAVSRLWLDRREVSLDSPGLSSGWHAAERAWRWTDGDAVLAVAGARELIVEVAMAGTYWRDDVRGDVCAACSSVSR